jgi:hypothetical protein
VLLAEQVDRHGQRRPLDRHAIERVQALVQRQRDQAPPRGAHQPHVDGDHPLRLLPARLRAAGVDPRRQRQIVARRPGDVVDERVRGVLQQHRVADRPRELGKDLRRPAPLQDQLGEAPVDLLPAPQQIELCVQNRAVDGFRDLDEAHRAMERDDRDAGLRARVDDPTGHGTPARAQLHGQRGHPLLDQRRDPRRLVRGLVAGAEPGRQHELAALEQIVRIAHLDHVRPAKLARDGAGDQLRQRPPDDGQLEHIRKAQHDGLSTMMA